MQKVSIWISSAKKLFGCRKNESDHKTATRGEMHNWLQPKKMRRKKIIFTYCQLTHCFAPIFCDLCIVFHFGAGSIGARSYLKLHLARDHRWIPLHINLGNFPHNFSRYALMYSGPEFQVAQKTTHPLIVQCLNCNSFRAFFKPFIRIVARYHYDDEKRILQIGAIKIGNKRSLCWHTLIVHFSIVYSFYSVVFVKYCWFWKTHTLLWGLVFFHAYVIYIIQISKNQ